MKKRRAKKNYAEERDLKKEKVMLRKGIITIEEIRRLWYEKENV